MKQRQELGLIADPLTGEIRHTLYSPANGLLFTLREYPVVYEGSLIARILDEIPAARRNWHERNHSVSIDTPYRPALPVRAWTFAPRARRAWR